MAGYLLGIDFGTGGVRAAVFDINGKQLGSGNGEYKTYYPYNGWAEQDTEEWLAALEKAVPEALSDAGAGADDIIALCCDATTNTIVFLDENNRPVRRPLLWMDVRASGEASYIDTIRDTQEATRFYKPGFRADTMIPKCMWIKKHEPENWDKSATVFEFEDYLNLVLTGRKSLSLSVAAFRGNYDTKNGGLPVSLYEACGIGDIVDKLPRDIYKVGEVIGNVSCEAAARFGLSEKTLVVEGTADCNACMVGVGSVEPGGMALIGGTSSCLLGLTREDFHKDGVNGSYPDCMYDGTSLIEGGQTASGAVLTWFRNNLTPASWEKEAEERNMSVYDLMSEKAAGVPIGCEGVVMLEHFQGNRAPYCDSKARGMFWGLSVGTTTAHMVRSVYEGVAYGANNCILSMREAGYEVREIKACGGISRSPFWLQMHADIIGVPIITTKYSSNAGCLGSAVIAAVGAGYYSGMPEGVKKMVQTDRRYEPDPEATEKYAFYMERYRETWPAMRDIVHRTVDHSD